MNFFTVSSKHARMITFTIEGLVRVKVTADKPLSVYVVDEGGRARYAAENQELQPLMQSLNSPTHEFVATTPSPWFLVLENTHAEEVRGAYTVEAPMQSPTGPSGALPMGYGGARRGY